MSKRRIAPLTFLRRLLLRTLAALAVFWGGGIALFSVVPVPSFFGGNGGAAD